MICFRTPLLIFLRVNYIPLIHLSLRILDSEGSARARRGQRPSEARRRRQAEPTPFTHDSFSALIGIGICSFTMLGKYSNTTFHDR